MADSVIERVAKVLFLIILCWNQADAQFHTITKKESPEYILLEKKSQLKDNKDDCAEIVNADTCSKIKSSDLYRIIRGKEKRNNDQLRKNQKTKPKSHVGSLLKPFILSELYDELDKCGVLYPEIVVAQAILETGWFTSSVFRNKNNLFGLTNPRTGKYYEFKNWRESVAAYRDKVQYKYKGGNYLLWLKEIGYAEDPRYVSSLIDILRKHLISG